MKFQINIEGRTYQVEIQDLRSRPISVIVDGEKIEVWPEESTTSQTKALDRKLEGLTLPPGVEFPTPTGAMVKVVRAPIPGVILSIAVKPQDEVSYGQELCVLEAMKMRNVLRSSRAGKIASLNVTVGQTVNHNDPLIEFEE